MPEIEPGDFVPEAPDTASIKQRLPADIPKANNPHCNILGIADNAFARKPILGAPGGTNPLIGILAGRNLAPADPVNFGKPNFPFSVTVARQRCPWFDQVSIPVHVRIDFIENINPVFVHTAPTQRYTLDWHRNDPSVSANLMTGAIPDPFPGDNGPWEVNVEVSLVEDPGQCTQAIHIKGTLLSGGYEHLAGMGIVIEGDDLPCVAFSQGLVAWTKFWTAVGPTPTGFPPPVKIIRTLTVTVNGGATGS